MNKTQNFKKALLFTLSLLPVAIIGGICTAIYQLDTLSEEMVQQAVSQLGGVEILIAITTLQTIMYALVCGFIGYIITVKTGLYKPFTLNKKGMLSSLVVGAFTGVLLGIDHFVSCAVYPEIQTVNINSFSLAGVTASILYGGIIEEVMIRLFFMSLIAIIIWKLFFRKYSANNIPQKVYIIANIVAAFAFAAGHLPATIGMFGELTPYLLIRCFALNGIAGYLFGELFRKHSIGYAMIAHATAHIVKFIIFAIFI
ncbi:MAG: CPBP family intramembrane metalloprotease [Ruminococcus sp.]|nr:CPBP family intramembrane metalloprotease [Ruminococcus sp.]